MPRTRPRLRLIVIAQASFPSASVILKVVGLLLLPAARLRIAATPNRVDNGDEHQSDRQTEEATENNRASASTKTADETQNRLIFLQAGDNGNAATDDDCDGYTNHKALLILLRLRIGCGQQF